MLKYVAVTVFGLLALGGVMAFNLTSPAFSANDRIPSQYTCDGDDYSPPLAWQEIPTGTHSFVLIVTDPDAPAGTWDHWILYNIPASIHALPVNMKALPPGTQVGENSWHKTTYNGPCPPDREHHYLFKLYALDVVLQLTDGATRPQLEAAMAQHILATTELVGRYQRVNR